MSFKNVYAQHEFLFKLLMLLLYIVFLALWAWWCSAATNPSRAHSVESVLESVLVDAPFQVAPPSSLKDVANEADVWMWLENTLIPGLWENKVYPATTPTNVLSAKARNKEDTYIRRFNFNLGAMLQQVRYRKSSDCLFDNIKLFCYVDGKSTFKSGTIKRSDLTTVEAAFNFSAIDTTDDETFGDDFMFDPDAPYADYGYYDEEYDGGYYGDPLGITDVPTPAPAPDVASSTPVPVRRRRRRYDGGVVQRMTSSSLRGRAAAAANATDKGIGLAAAFEPTKLKTQGLGDNDVYAIYLDPDYSKPNALAVLSALKDFLWIDKETKLLRVTVPVYNNNIGLFLKMEVTFHFTTGGRVEKAVQVGFAQPLSKKDSNFTIILGIGCFLCVAFIALIAYTVAEVTVIYRAEMRREGGATRGQRLGKFAVGVATNFWQVMNVLTIALFVLVAVMYVTLQLSLSEITASFAALIKGDSTSEEVNALVIDISEAQDLNTLFVMATALLTLLLFINGIRFFNISPSMGLMAETLGRAAAPLASFSALFLFLFASFALMGYLSFGAVLTEFSTLFDATMTCATLLFGAGESSYSNMKLASPVLAPLYFWGFFLLTVLILTNVFIAILAEYYVVAKEARQKKFDEKRRAKRRAQKKAKDRGGANDTSPFADDDVDPYASISKLMKKVAAKAEADGVVGVASPRKSKGSRIRTPRSQSPAPPLPPE